MRNDSPVKWDLFVRVFHWSLVLFFALAYLSGDFNVEDLHGWFGYVITVLIVGRFVWGFAGSANARFANFIYSPAETLAYFASVIKNNPRHYVSHNPAGALMVFALLASLVALVASGLLLEDWGEYEGPLWAMHVSIGDALGHLAKYVHKALPEILLAMVGLHILGVVVATLQHRENFVHAMWYGQEKPRD
ncbi:MAG TPA: cytochrome b/b6 domain-containing protein [Mariprofundaceae bacterium]|nr:cytochrome b/b6 domain-containing protein [Mariprofundaceae bacterium]